MIEKPNFFLFTGGPGVGKTTLLDHLRAQGHRCVEESHRRVIREQVASGGRHVPWLDQAGYLERVAREDVVIFDGLAAETDERIFFDRGILDYATDCDPPAWLTEAGWSRRYNRRVFVFPPWREIYRQDAERRQTWAECEVVHGRILEGLAAFGYEAVIVPPGRVEDRARFVLDRAELRHPPSA
jgi:predicted ATPase